MVVSVFMLVAGNREISDNSLTQPLVSSSTSLLPDFFLFRQKQLLDCVDENCLTEKINSKGKYRYDEQFPAYGQPIIDYDWTKPRNVIDMESELIKKRTETSPYDESHVQLPPSCACQTKFELIDLGNTHFPRYHLNAVCENRNANSVKCWRGSKCKEIPYKVRVLTHRPHSETMETDELSSYLPEALRDKWKFKTIIVHAACQCAL